MVLLLPDSESKNYLLLKDGQSSGLLKPGFLKSLFSLALIVFLAILVINVYVYSYGKKFTLSDASQTPFGAVSGDTDQGDVPVAIVLGASVYSDGTLSPMLEQRAETAFDLYKNGVVRKILVSGDNKTASYNEVIPIRTYLLQQGVPAQDIFTDFAGFNTYDSMYRADKIFGAKNVIVVTQSFHLPRAIYAARSLGLNAYGVSAGTLSDYFKDNTREVFATVKTFYMVSTHAQSLFLGRQIPVTGDGRESLK